MTHLSYTKNFKGLLDVFLHDPRRYTVFAQLVAQQMIGDGAFTAAERELVALHVSNLNDCAYCIGSHRAVLVAMGMEAAVIDGADPDPANPPTPRMAAVYGFARKLTFSLSEVGRADVETLCAAGWTEQAVEDVVGIVSLFAYLNRLANGLGIEGAPEVFDAVGPMIAEQGYAPLVEMVGQKADSL